MADKISTNALTFDDVPFSIGSNGGLDFSDVPPAASAEDLMTPAPTGSPQYTAQQMEIQRRNGVLAPALPQTPGPRLGDMLKEGFGGHNPIAEATDNFMQPALDAVSRPTPKTQAEKDQQAFQDSRSAYDRVLGPPNYLGEVATRALTQGQHGLGDWAPGEAARLSQSFERANAPQLEALQKAGDLAAGTAGVDFARPLPPAADVHRPQLPASRALAAKEDLAAFKEAGVRPFAPAFAQGPVAGLAKSLADTPWIGAPVRNALEESLSGTKGVADEIASRFGNAATEEQAGRAVQEGIERYKDARPDDIVRERLQADAPSADARGGDAGGPQTFTTAKGSIYEVQPDGTTVRNKAARNDPGHEGDSGIKSASERTYYVDPQDGQALAPPQNAKWQIVDHGDGTVSLATQNRDGRWGISSDQRNIPVSTKPEIGKQPLELWDGGKTNNLDSFGKVHLGNDITEVNVGRRQQQRAANPDQWRNDIIAAPSRETSRKTKTEALYDEAWNHIPPEMQVGRSKEGDARFLGGLGNTANELDKIVDRNLGMMNRARADRDGTIEVTRAGDEVAPIGRQVAVRGGTIPEAAMPALGGQLGRILRDIASRQWRGTLQDMRELRSALRRLSSGTPDAEKNTLQKADVERLRAAVSRDMQFTLERNAKAYASKGERGTAAQILRAKQLFQRADDFYRLSQQRIDAIETLFAAKSPEAVYRNVLQAAQAKGGNVAKLRALGKILRDDERGEFAAGVLNQLGRPVASARGFSQELGFSVASWVTNWNKLSTEGKVALFGTEHAKALEGLSRIARRLGDVEAQANTSRSGTHGTNIAGLAATGGAIMTGNFAYILGTAATGLGASVLLSRPAYARWATQYAVFRARALSGQKAAIRPLHEQIRMLATMAKGDPRLIPVVIDAARDNGLDVDPNSNEQADMQHGEQ